MTASAGGVPVAGGTAGRGSHAGGGAPPPRPISGTTRLYVVIGDPVEQVQAPALMNPVFTQAGLDAVLVPVHARPDEFATVFAGLRGIANLDGILITIPHKVAAARLADLRSPAAAVSGSANALRREPDGRWRADNFDGAGFVRGLARAGHTVAGARVRLVGAGGAGSAIAVALLESGCADLTISDPDQDRLTDLLDRLAEHWPDRCRATDGLAPGRPGPDADASDDAPAPARDSARDSTVARHSTVARDSARARDGASGDLDLIVNATPVGLRPDDPLPFDPADLPAGCVVADIIMKPPRTPLLLAAAARGLPAHPGIHMLAEQVDLYRSFFHLPAAR